MKSKQNVGPLLLYSHKCISSVCQIKASTLSTVSCAWNMYKKKNKQSTGAFGDKTESGSVGEMGEGGRVGRYTGRMGGRWVVVMLYFCFTL